MTIQPVNWRVRKREGGWASRPYYLVDAKLRKWRGTADRRVIYWKDREKAQQRANELNGGVVTGRWESRPR